MEYRGKYKKMADQFRRDGADEATIEKWIREEMDQDEFRAGEGITDLSAWKVWQSWPEERRELYLHNAYCSNCRVASFAKGYIIRKDRYGLIVEGRCASCGEKITRCCD